MGTGQMMLTVLATFLLTTVILTSNRSLLTNTETLIKAKQDLVTVSLASSLLERAARLDFDAATISATPASSSLLGACGIEAGEVVWMDSLFNDIDDYNGFLDTIKMGTKGSHDSVGDVYYLSAAVVYVNEADPWGTPLSGASRSWLKRIEVKAWPQGAMGLVDTFFIAQLHGYWKWR